MDRDRALVPKIGGHGCERKLGPLQQRSRQVPATRRYNNELCWIRDGCCVNKDQSIQAGLPVLCRQLEPFFCKPTNLFHAEDFVVVFPL